MIRVAIALGCATALACSSPEGSEPVDLMESAYVVFAPVDEQPVPSRIELGGDVRHSLAASLPAEFRYRIEIPERASLTFAIAIVTAPGADPDATLPGSRVRCTVRAGETQASEVLFERDVHVARRGEWIEQEADLRALSGKHVWLASSVFSVSRCCTIAPVIGGAAASSSFRSIRCGATT